MLTNARDHSRYDLPTAVTFLFAGLALGWMAAVLFAPQAAGFARRKPTLPVPQSVADEVFLG